VCRTYFCAALFVALSNGALQMEEATLFVGDNPTIWPVTTCNGSPPTISVLVTGTLEVDQKRLQKHLGNAFSLG
jgi:hypothetical protein